MNITPNEISDIFEVGSLDGNPVKMVRTKGGFFIACSKLKGKSKEEALTAGSHPAIVKYNLEKMYPGFQPSMMKSELLSDGSIVEKHSHFLSDDLRKSGHDIYSVENGAKVKFYVTKYGANLNSVDGLLKDDSLVIQKLNLPEQFIHALAGATSEKALSCNKNKVKVDL